MEKSTPATIDEYILTCEESIRPLLHKLRETIRQAAPDAEETISYKMPAFRFHGMLVYFAAYKNHIGFYPTSSGITAFEKQLSGYKTSKGAVQFPIREDLPFELVRQIVAFRVEEQLNRKRRK